MTSPAGPRILMIAPAIPATRGNGLAMRLGMFLEALASIGETELVVVPVAGSAKADRALPERLGIKTRLMELEGRADTRFALLSRLKDPKERLTAFRSYGRPSLAAALSQAVLAELRSLAAEGRYDVVHVGRLYLAEAGLAADAKCKTIDLDDDDADTYRGRAAILRQESDRDGADWASAEADAFAGLAKNCLPKFDAVFRAGERTGIFPSAELVPNGVDGAALPRFADDGRSVLFVGSLGYAPNADGIGWFARRVWPKVQAGTSGRAKLLIAGGPPPPDILALDGRNGISVLGAVPDLEPLYRQAALAVAPVRSGGGTRIKLIEAAILGIPFAATSVAASGLIFGNARCGWIGDDEVSLADAVVNALADPAERRRRAAHALRLARTHHLRRMVVSRLADRFRSLIERGERDGAR